jgi:hypothetical protein
VLASDTTEAVISKLLLNELPTVYDPSKVTLYFNGTPLVIGEVLSSYGIQKFAHLTSLYVDGCNEGPPWDKWEVPGECGFHRFMRLRLLGYI